MRLLLDNCTFLWVSLDPSQLSARAMQHIKDPANDLLLSTVSAWALSIAYGSGRLSLVQPPAVFVPAQRQLHRVECLLLEEEAALYLPNLPRIHRDPFDRMLVCQAMVHDLTILTPDPLIRQYPVKTDW